eukprot:15467407-Alexandrium_andersonii.AAC.1
MSAPSRLSLSCRRRCAKRGASSDRLWFSDRWGDPLRAEACNEAVSCFGRAAPEGSCSWSSGPGLGSKS